MLDTTEKFEKAFDLMEEDDLSYISLTLEMKKGGKGIRDLPQWMIGKKLILL